MNNEIKINVPEGMEIDKENSTFECIKFKPKWIPKRGDIAVAGDDNFCKQIILIAEYIKPSDIVGSNIKPLALLSSHGLSIYVEDSYPPVLWIKQKASDSEKEQLIKALNKKGYVYDPNDLRVIYKKEKGLPKTWEEFCENNLIKPEEYFVSTASNITSAYDGELRKRGSHMDANLLPSEEYAEAMLALCKLIQLRDCYNKGWKPDWSDKSEKHCIFYNKGNVELFVRNSWSCILVFKSRELRNKFYNNFKDLIEQAKLLL